MRREASLALGSVPRQLNKNQMLLGAWSRHRWGTSQWCQRRVSGVSGPSLRSGPVLFEVARARRSLLLLCHPEIRGRPQKPPPPAVNICDL